jgi:hypothetical protein
MTASAGPALKELHSEFGDRVGFVSLYVREAHPGDDYPQPDSAELKMTHARAYRDREELPWPVVVDDIDGTLHRQLDPKPHAAYLMGADGQVLWRTMWANVPELLEDGLRAAAADRIPDRREREPRLRPMLTGAARMWDVLGQAGGHARTDVAREAPPMLLTAWLAWLLAPLPMSMRARGALATGLSMAPLVGVATWVALAISRRAR